MRTRILGLILLALCSLQSQLHAATPPEAAKLDGLTIQLPPNSGWNQTKSSAQQIVYERTAQDRPVTLTYSTAPIEPQLDDQAFFRFAEARQAQTFSKLEMVSVHYYDGTHKQGAPCVRYDGIFKDKSAKTLPFVSVRGLLCRHPVSSGKMIQMELAQRSGTREAAYKADLSETADQAFGATRFTGGVADAAR